MSSSNASLIQLSIESPNEAALIERNIKAKAATLEQLVDIGVDIPFVTFYQQTFKMAVSYPNLTTQGAVADFGGSSSIDISLVNADFMLGVFIDFTLPAVTCNSGYKAAWVENIGDVIITQADFLSSTLEFEKIRFFVHDIYREYFVPEGRQRGYKEMIGQQTIKPLYEGDPDSPAFLHIDDMVKVNPNLSGTDSAAATFTTYVGTPSPTAASATTTAYYLVGMPVTTTNPMPSADDFDDTITPVTYTPIDSDGMVLQGTNGLQTWKASHSSTVVTHKFKFWWCLDPKTALYTVSLARASTTTITYYVRPFADLIRIKDGSALATALSSSITPTLVSSIYAKIVFVENPVQTVFSDIEFSMPVKIFTSDTTTITHNTPRSITPQHMVEEAFFLFQNKSLTTAKMWSRYHYYSAGTLTEKYQSPITQLELLLNSDPIANRNERFFRLAHILDIHTRVPDDTFIYPYSFSLDPESEQLTAYMNFSSSVNMQIKAQMRNDLTDTFNMYFAFLTKQIIRYSGNAMGRAYIT